MYKDNQVYVILATHRTATHMPPIPYNAIKYHWFCIQLSKEIVCIVKIEGKLQWANILTKALPQVQFKAKWKMLIGW